MDVSGEILRKWKGCEVEEHRVFNLRRVGQFWRFKYGKRDELHRWQNEFILGELIEDGMIVPLGRLEDGKWLAP